jgi:hypothetical protein
VLTNAGISCDNTFYSGLLQGYPLEFMVFMYNVDPKQIDTALGRSATVVGGANKQET